MIPFYFLTILMGVLAWRMWERLPGWLALLVMANALLAVFFLTRRVLHVLQRRQGGGD
jgi:hypothetical protein